MFYIDFKSENIKKNLLVFDNWQVISSDGPLLKLFQGPLDQILPHVSCHQGCGVGTDRQRSQQEGQVALDSSPEFV